MADWTSIFNGALLPLGQREVTSIDDATSSARKCKAVYLNIADEVVYSHPWKVALRRLHLAASATAPIFGYSHAYDLPNDPYCLRVWRVGDEDGHWFDEDCGRWEVEGRQILTEMSGPLKVRFIARITDPNQYSGLLATAVSRRLAAEVAYSLTNSREAEAQAQQDYEKILTQARSLDSQQGTPERVANSEILASRY